MSGTSINTANLAYVEELFRTFKTNPAALEPSWQHFFQGFELGLGGPAGCAGVAENAAREAQKQSQVASLIFAYRSLGHRAADLDPLNRGRRPLPPLDPSQFDLDEGDLDRPFDTGHLAGQPRQATLREIIALLGDTYCRTLGVEYLHIQDIECRRWLQVQMEPHRNRPPISRAKRLGILRQLIDATLFESFIAQRYPGQKRFSLEGAETLIPAIHYALELGAELGHKEVIMGMAHRGRLNVLANILRKSYAHIFAEFEENLIPFQYGGDGDVKYHKGFSSDIVTSGGQVLHVSLTANPSHLEAVNPVVQGRARAKQRRLDDTLHRQAVLPLCIHGDAAFAGQGLVCETLNLSQLPGYCTGGTLHLIINNQIGFTTLPEEARSTPYCSDVAKMIEAPIFHVNGDDPEAVVHAVEVALRYRQRFGRDVVVDMFCYRRHGHNEGDEPAFTQPLMYRNIKDHPPVRDLYTRTLIEDGDLTVEQEERITAAFKDELMRAYEEVKAAQKHPPTPERDAFLGVWAGLEEGYSHEPVETGVARSLLVEVARALSQAPDGFNLHPKVARQVVKRAEIVENGGDIKNVDWAFAEALAFGTLLCEGNPVRLSGQDSARGTFSQRHAVWQDRDTQSPYVPLKHIRPGQASFCVYNSLLSEAAVLGFDYGYALDEPQMLILWEAQFGDFANGAQVIIDQFIVSSQAKWQRQCGLVLLLPHGYEGQGPEHSNAYLERYLMACAEDNIQVCNVSTPAQYFHLLRRQLRRRFRRPLIIMAPKSLLRHPACLSPVTALEQGSFYEILDDEQAPPSVSRLVLCSGKVYYDLAASREAAGSDGAAIVRIEQFYPLSPAAMQALASRYASVSQVIWAQEEPENRGGFRFMAPLLRRWFPSHEPRYVGRPASASPATGSLGKHRAEQARIVEEALRG